MFHGYVATRGLHENGIDHRRRTAVSLGFKVRAGAILLLPGTMAGCVSNPDVQNARPIETPVVEQRLLQSGHLECRKVSEPNGPIYTVSGYPCPDGFFEVGGG